MLDDCETPNLHNRPPPGMDDCETSLSSNTRFSPRSNEAHARNRAACGTVEAPQFRPGVRQRLERKCILFSHEQTFASRAE